MAFEPHDRPAWLRAANAAGRALERLGIRPRLDPEELLATARRRTGLADFGADDWREPYSILAAALEGEADLHPFGRRMARREILGLLENRLRVEDVHARHPEAAAQPVRAPIFVTGSGRSGTSILHELLAQDPANRALLTWEALHPCPPPEPASHGRDPRIARADREVREWERIAPAYATMHEMGGAVPQECIYLSAIGFRSDLLSGFYSVPSYAAWLASCDMRIAYRTHLRVLQVLQLRMPTSRWVLKAPSHLWTLEELLAVYPDARIVQTHRDPARVVASMASLAATLYWMRTDRVDPRAVARRIARSLAFMLEKSMAQREAGLLPATRVFDVRYADLMDDPFGTLGRLYAHFGMELTAEAESRMRAYLASRPQHRRGVHRYDLAWAGLDPERERRRFRAYRERYGVPAEA